MRGSSCGSGPIRPRWNGVTSVKLLQRIHVVNVTRIPLEWQPSDDTHIESPDG